MDNEEVVKDEFIIEEPETVENLESEYMEFLKQEIAEYCNENGAYEMYWDYRDEIEEKDFVSALDGVIDGTYDNVVQALSDKYFEYNLDYENNFTDTVLSDLRNHPELEAYQEQREQDTGISIYEDLDEAGYAGLDMNIESLLNGSKFLVNIIFGTPAEQNSDMSAIITSYGTYHNPDIEFVEVSDLDNALTKLIHQQGYSIKEVYNGLFGVAKSESKFINSVVEELENNTAEAMSGLTVCVSLDWKTLETLYKAHHKGEAGAVTLDVGTTLGLVNIWNGSGSMLGIELEKPFTMSIGDIQSIQVENATVGNYTVNEIFGMGSDAWTDTLSLTGEVGETYTEDLEEALAYAKTLDVEEEE